LRIIKEYTSDENRTTEAVTSEEILIVSALAANKTNSYTEEHDSRLRVV